MDPRLGRLLSSHHLISISQVRAGRLENNDSHWGQERQQVQQVYWLRVVGFMEPDRSMVCLVPAIATQCSNCQYLHREALSSRGFGCSHLTMIQKWHFSSQGGMIRIEVWTRVLFWFLFLFKQNKTVEDTEATSSFLVRDLLSLPFQGEQSGSEF